MFKIIDTSTDDFVYNHRILNKIKGPVVKVGYIQRWNGKRIGFDYLKRIDDAITSDYEVKLIMDDDGILKRYEIHHDGTNYFELYHPNLNEEDFIEEIYDCSPHENLNDLIEHVREFSEPFTIKLLPKGLAVKSN